jgi:hypothetical protein
MGQGIGTPLFLGLLGAGAAVGLLSQRGPRSRSEWLASFTSWAGPASATQDEKVDRTERMIREALGKDRALVRYPHRVIANGSSPNNTNTKLASDLDLVVVAHEAAPWCRPAPGEQLPFVPNGVSIVTEHAKFRGDVLSALRSTFDWWNVDEDNKCLRVAAKETTRVVCDVLLSFRFRQHLPRSTRYNEGIIFVTTTGEQIVSYPEQHLANGRAKNVATSYRYKQIVRVLKKLKTDFEDGATLLTAVPLPASFEIESVVYNASDKVLTAGDLFDGVEGTLKWAAAVLTDATATNALMEPNGLRPLFPRWSQSAASLLTGHPEGAPEPIRRLHQFVWRALETIAVQTRRKELPWL